MSTHVNADNFARAETDRMFADIQRDAGGVNTFRHNREPASIDAQTVIRLNRDTLYSFAIVDLSEGATLVVPDAGERYLSVMIVDRDHYVRAVLHDAGTYDLADQAPGADYVLVAARTLVDPDDPDDMVRVAEVQDALQLEAASSVTFAGDEYDPASLDATRSALLALAAGLRSFERTFGARDEVDPVRHLIGTAAGWGGLPVSEASYVGVDPQLPVGFYDLSMHDVPVDAFWSVSVYNAEGYFQPNDEGRYTVNSVTGHRDEDGVVTVHFTPPGAAAEPNSIPLPEGWNYLIRLYRPQPAFGAGEWHVPDLVRRRDREAEFAADHPTDEGTDAAAGDDVIDEVPRDDDGVTAGEPDEAASDVADAAPEADSAPVAEAYEGPDVEVSDDVAPPANAADGAHREADTGATPVA
ncbi:DUF1214 domain-containing protein [Microbacterium gallinarum]|uniref:DUF1254 domain-containing protein n=1 Tax=Microbacterium gallinarum TaxID=2762209 RepID=A0ABR8X1S7_9MICO|nr:DUF1214 domain-containing protein [Microbacterium gallinarum]MBD8023082.1 DUF1254 domain-containing protein [Microbacterium gallinarum]